MGDKRDRGIVACSGLSGILILANYDKVATIINWISCILILSIILSAPSFHPKMYWRVGFNYVLTIMTAILIPIYQFKHISIACLQLIFAVFTSVILFLFPLPSSCQLNGPYDMIGTLSFVIDLKTSDVNGDKDYRQDVYNNTLPVQCWFPLSYKNTLQYLYIKIFKSRSLLWTSGHPKEQYYESVELLHQISINFHIPNLLLRHHSLSRMNSIWQDNFYHMNMQKNGMDHKLPIAIYSHGMYGWKQIASSVCENLASHGFLVFACDHAPDSMLSRPIGDRKNFHPFDYFPPKGCSDIEERHFHGCGVNRRVNDIQQLLDFIFDGRLIKKYPELCDRLDVKQVCLWGHSFGGNTVTSVGCIDHRPSKIVALDAWMYPMPNHIRQKGIQGAAVLSLSAHHWPFAKYQVPFRRDCIVNSSSKRPIFDLVIKGTDHQNYCDTHLLASKYILQRPTVLGKDVEPKKVAYNLDLLISGFFCANDDHIVYQSEFSLPVQAESAPEALIAYLSLNEVGPSKLYELQHSLKRFISKYVIHESLVEGFCDATYFDKVMANSLSGSNCSDVELSSIVLSENA